jgi:hypothetical protein
MTLATPKEFIQVCHTVIEPAGGEGQLSAHDPIWRGQILACQSTRMDHLQLGSAMCYVHQQLSGHILASIHS